MSENQKMTQPRILDLMVVGASFGSEMETNFPKIVGAPSALPKNLRVETAVVGGKGPEHTDSLGKNSFYTAV